uniref:Uncharacterized protein n=1 Tax=Ciona intestinalis TaxID=7719 RepID=H2XWT6_CIOIN
MKEDKGNEFCCSVVLYNCTRCVKSAVNGVSKKLRFCCQRKNVKIKRATFQSFHEENLFAISTENLRMMSQKLLSQVAIPRMLCPALELNVLMLIKLPRLRYGKNVTKPMQQRSYSQTNK